MRDARGSQTGEITIGSTPENARSSRPSASEIAITASTSRSVRRSYARSAAASSFQRWPLDCAGERVEDAPLDVVLFEHDARTRRESAGVADVRRHAEVAEVDDVALSPLELARKERTHFGVVAFGDQIRQSAEDSQSQKARNVARVLPHVNGLEDGVHDAHLRKLALECARSFAINRAVSKRNERDGFDCVERAQEPELREASDAQTAIGRD
jgi:hypothetical protein